MARALKSYRYGWRSHCRPAAPCSWVSFTPSSNPRTGKPASSTCVSRMHSHYGVLPLRNARTAVRGGRFRPGYRAVRWPRGAGGAPGWRHQQPAGTAPGPAQQQPENPHRLWHGRRYSRRFHTPLAGVIFAMEVIVAEYTVAGFMPVMLAAVAASAVSRNLSVGGALLSIPAVEFSSLLEIPYILLLGLACGSLLPLSYAAEPDRAPLPLARDRSLYPGGLLHRRPGADGAGNPGSGLRHPGLDHQRPNAYNNAAPVVPAANCSPRQSVAGPACPWA